MSLSPSIAFAAAMLLPLAASAQGSAQPDPASPEEAVPAVSYQSALAGYQSMSEDAETPDTAWFAANRHAGLLGGHAGQIRHAGGPAETLHQPVPKSPSQHGKHHGDGG